MIETLKLSASAVAWQMQSSMFTLITLSMYQSAGQLFIRICACRFMQNAGKKRRQTFCTGQMGGYSSFQLL